MKHEKIDQANMDKADAGKTLPPGMAPDKAHAGLKPRGTEPDVETEETFDNSPNNAGATGNRRLK
jgi:hypothetical protein